MSPLLTDVMGKKHDAFNPYFYLGHKISMLSISDSHWVLGVTEVMPDGRLGVQKPKITLQYADMKTFLQLLDGHMYYTIPELRDGTPCSTTHLHYLDQIMCPTCSVF